jgi:hypothetical protein
MDETDPGAALITRNQAMLAQAVEVRLRTQEARARAEQAVQRAMHGIVVSKERLQWVAPAFHLRATRLDAPVAERTAEFFRSQIARIHYLLTGITDRETVDGLKRLAAEQKARLAEAERCEKPDER